MIMTIPTVNKYFLKQAVCTRLSPKCQGQKQPTKNTRRHITMHKALDTPKALILRIHSMYKGTHYSRGFHMTFRWHLFWYVRCVLCPRYTNILMAAQELSKLQQWSCIHMSATGPGNLPSVGPLPWMSTLVLVISAVMSDAADRNPEYINLAYPKCRYPFLPPYLYPTLGW